MLKAVLSYIYYFVGILLRSFEGVRDYKMTGITSIGSSWEFLFFLLGTLTIANIQFLCVNRSVCGKCFDLMAFVQQSKYCIMMLHPILVVLRTCCPRRFPLKCLLVGTSCLCVYRLIYNYDYFFFIIKLIYFYIKITLKKVSLRNDFTLFTSLLRSILSCGKFLQLSYAVTIVTRNALDISINWRLLLDC